MKEDASSGPGEDAEVDGRGHGHPLKPLAATKSSDILKVTTTVTGTPQIVDLKEKIR